ncbi:hypothetical protein [Lutibacter maritimus]|uniref:Apea-like HEPN domain-containing protein n=1 Tax=Lutibacter maritimus TaxID=593133 RepID=A0A1I6SWV0_9FLAO|nr:hypothetical protein [Lutibacter maritimus]SFS81451.1 hypothetical protein SAMN04488006_0181 [Lutibacter maritimus]
MKSHSKRKFVGNFKTDFHFSEIENYNDYAKKTTEVDFNEYPKVLIQTNDKNVTLGFVHLVSGKPIAIPEPEPSILYFTNAESKLSELLRLQDLIQKSEKFDNVDELSYTFYNFFQLSSDFTINLFTSIEAFNNGLIPDDFFIKIKGKKFDKNRTQRSMDFLIKIKKAIPEIMNKSYFKDYQRDYDFLLKFKKLRDNVVHTKNIDNGFLSSYRELYISYLIFDFKKSYELVKNYMNYYKENWIENCDCGI